MKNPFNFFDEIYCINLDERPDRWEHSQEQFYKLGILDKVKRYSAIKPTLDERWKRDVPWGKGKYRYPLVGAVGCAESHKAIIRLAKEKNLKNVMVFEDDFIVSENWFEILNPAITELQKHNWHNFYLGYLLNNAWGLKVDVSENLGRCLSKKHRGIQLTTALAYNSTIFDHLINNINPFNYNHGREGHVDKYYCKDRRILKFYAKPPVVHQNPELGTDIQ